MLDLVLKLALWQGSDAVLSALVQAVHGVICPRGRACMPVALICVMCSLPVLTIFVCLPQPAILCLPFHDWSAVCFTATPSSLNECIQCM